MRLTTIGRDGQLARALAEEAQRHSDITPVFLGREALRPLSRSSVEHRLAETAPEIVINTAAYTAVDAAETARREAALLNADLAGWIASAAASLSLPLIHISTDYVFDGEQKRAYRETDAARPINVYGATKLDGETRVLAHHPAPVILRTAWLFSPHGSNFVKTMLGLAETRDEISVVADQHGSPTEAGNLAATIVALARRLADGGARDGSGVFHAAGASAASWSDLAESVFRASAERGGPIAQIRRISTAEYPMRARRPVEATLDSGKLFEAHGLRLRPWRDVIDKVVERLLAKARPISKSAGGRV